MQIIYRPQDISEAHIVASLLQANGIRPHVGGHYLQGGIGDLPAGELAAVYVADNDIKRAKTIVADYESRTTARARGNRQPAWLPALLIIAVSVLLILFFAVTYGN